MHEGFLENAQYNPKSPPSFHLTRSCNENYNNTL